MNNIHDGTHLAYILLLWDHIEELLTERPASTVLGLLAAATLIILRQWLDVLVISALVSWNNGLNSTRGIYELLRSHPFLSAGTFVVMLAGAMVSNRLTPSEVEHEAVVAHGQPQAASKIASRPQKELEHVFAGYLEHLVNSTPASIAVEYVPSGVKKKGDTTFRSPSAGGDPATMVFKVLTPDFYSRFIHYAHDSEAIFSELAEHRTIWVDHPEFLPDIFLKKGSSPLHAPGVVEFVCFEMVRKLRRRPSTLGQSSSPSGVGRRSLSDIRGFRISSMDAYVLAQDDDGVRRAYRTILIRLFVADRAFGGSYMAVTLVLVAVRLTLWCIAAAFVADLFPKT